MNVLERAECLLDAGSAGNMNFVVIGEYGGQISPSQLREALHHLQGQHELLRSTIVWEGHRCRFAATSAAIEVRQQPAQQPSDWPVVARAELSETMPAEGPLLWKVAHLQNQDGGQIFLTFHHAIADGLSAMALVEQLFAGLGRLQRGKRPLSRGSSEFVPNLEHFQIPSRVEAESPAPAATKLDQGLSTGYALAELDETATSALIDWGRQRGLRMNATIHAAFLLALAEAGALPGQEACAVTVVNLRQFFSPPVEWDVMRLLRVCIETPVSLQITPNLESLAHHLHQELQKKLAAGEHLEALGSIAEAVAPDPSPQELWRNSYRQGAVITNLGQVPVGGVYGELELHRLFFVANVEPIVLPEALCAVIGALTFRNRLFLTLFHIEQQLGDAQAKEVLHRTTSQLLALVEPQGHAIQ